MSYKFWSPFYYPGVLRFPKIVFFTAPVAYYRVDGRSDGEIVKSNYRNLALSLVPTMKKDDSEERAEW